MSRIDDFVLPPSYGLLTITANGGGGGGGGINNGGNGGAGGNVFVGGGETYSNTIPQFEMVIKNNEQDSRIDHLEDRIKKLEMFINNQLKYSPDNEETMKELEDHFMGMSDDTIELKEPKT